MTLRLGLVHTPVMPFGRDRKIDFGETIEILVIRLCIKIACRDADEFRSGLDQ